MAYLGNSPFQLSQLPSATIPFTGSQFAVNLVPNTVSALDLGSSTNPWRNVYGNVVGTVTNVAGGAANRILYQTSLNSTAFVTAPTVTDTYLKWNSSTGFSWSTVSSGSTLLGLTQSESLNGANPYGNTVLGSGAYASGNNNNSRFNVVVGTNAYSTWYESVVLGYNAKAEGGQSIAIGVSARARTDNSMVIGANAIIGLSSGQSISIGSSSSVSDYTGESTVLGYNAKSYATGGTAVGHYSQARGNYSQAVGKGSYASGSNSTAIGYNSYAYGSNSIVIGPGVNDNYYSALILNATGTGLAANSNGFYVDPIQNATTTNALYYDPSTKQITYGTASSGSSLIVKYNGSTLSSAATSIDFTGSGLTVTNTGGAITVNVAASAGGSSETPTVTTTKITPSSIMDSGSNYIDIQFSSPSIATYVRESLQALSTIAIQYNYNISSFMATQMPDAFVNLQLTNSSQASFQVVGSTTVRGQSSQWGWYNFSNNNPSAQKYIGFTLDSSVVISMNLSAPKVLSIGFSNPSVATQIATMFATNKPSSFTAYRGYTPAIGGNGYYSCVENSITTVEVAGASLVITSSQNITEGGGGPSSPMLGLNLGVTTTSSGGGSSLLTNGWAISSVNTNNPNSLVIDFTSAEDLNSYVTSINTANQILQTFAQTNNTYAQIQLYTVNNNNVYMLNTPYNPTVMKPMVTANSPTQLGVDASNGYNSISLANFPQWSDNTNRIWNGIFFGGGNWSQMQYNPQFGSPTTAKVWPSMPSGLDLTNATITTIQSLLTANIGVQNVVISVYGYNSANGNNEITNFYGCSQITYDGSVLQFTYTTSQVQYNGGYGGYYLRLSLDIQ